MRDVPRGLILLGLTFQAWFSQAAWSRAQDYHPWALFEVGCWRQVKVVTETLDATGKIESVSTADTKTTLTAVDDTSYSLRIDMTSEVAGRRFQAGPQFVKHGFYGEIPGQAPTVRVLGAGEVTICGRRIPTEIQEFAVDCTEGKRISTLHVSESVSPYVLKRETKVSKGNTEPPVVESQVEVLAVDMPYKVLMQVKPAAFVKTVQMQRNVVVKSTIEVQCVEVPGVVVAHSCQELDTNGRVVRRSTLELVDYKMVQPARTPALLKDEPRRRFFRHFRTRRP